MYFCYIHVHVNFVTYLLQISGYWGKSENPAFNHQEAGRKADIWGNLVVITCDEECMCECVCVISLRHGSYQNTALAAANRAQLQQGLRLQLTRPESRKAGGPWGVSAPQGALLGGSGGPAVASFTPPAAADSRLRCMGNDRRRRAAALPLQTASIPRRQGKSRSGVSFSKLKEPSAQTPFSWKVWCKTCFKTLVKFEDSKRINEKSEK